MYNYFIFLMFYCCNPLFVSEIDIYSLYPRPEINEFDEFIYSSGKYYALNLNCSQDTCRYPVATEQGSKRINLKIKFKTSLPLKSKLTGCLMRNTKVIGYFEDKNTFIAMNVKDNTIFRVGAGGNF